MIDKRLLVAVPIIFIITTFFIFLYPTFAPSCTERLYAMNVSTLDEILNLSEYTFDQNGLSYLECSMNKERIVSLCEQKTGEARTCNEGVATVYLMYLSKTMQTSTPPILIDMLYNSLSDSGFGFSRQDIGRLIDDFLNGGSETIGLVHELAVFRGNDDILGDDMPEAEYFNNIRAFSHATDLEDCDDIVYSNISLTVSLLLDGACRLSFSDRDEFCWELTKREIDYCKDI